MVPQRITPPTCCRPQGSWCDGILTCGPETLPSIGPFIPDVGWPFPVNSEHGREQAVPLSKFWVDRQGLATLQGIMGNEHREQRPRAVLVIHLIGLLHSPPVSVELGQEDEDKSAIWLIAYWQICSAWIRHKCENKTETYLEGNKDQLYDLRAVKDSEGDMKPTIKEKKKTNRQIWYYNYNFIWTKSSRSKVKDKPQTKGNSL